MREWGRKILVFLCRIFFFVSTQPDDFVQGNYSSPSPSYIPPLPSVLPSLFSLFYTPVPLSPPSYTLSSLIYSPLFNLLFPSLPPYLFSLISTPSSILRRMALTTIEDGALSITDRQTRTDTDRQTGRQAQTDRQTDGQTDRQTECLPLFLRISVPRIS